MIIDDWLIVYLFDLFRLYYEYSGKQRACLKANKKKMKKKRSVFFLQFGFWQVLFFLFGFWEMLSASVWFLGSVFSFYLVAGMCGISSSVLLLRSAFCFHFWEVLFNSVWLLRYAYLSVLLLVTNWTFFFFSIIWIYPILLEGKSLRAWPCRFQVENSNNEYCNFPFFP